MKALVTGGHGFIGHHFVKSFLEDNRNDVLVIDAHYDYGTIDREYLDNLIKKRIDYIGEHRSIIKPIKDLDINDKRIIRNFNPDIIYHFATVPRQYEVSKNLYEAVNNATTGLLTLLELKPPRFVYISTSMVYGDFTQNTTEEAIPNPKSQYGIIRLMCEEFAKAYCTKNNIDLVIVRPSAVYGERDSNIRVVGRMFDKALKNEVIDVMGSNEVLDFTYVKDLVNGLIGLLSLFKGKNIHTYPMIINLTYSDPKPKTLLDLASIIVNLTHGNKDLIRVNSRNDQYPIRSTLSNDKARDLFEFDPEINLGKGLMLVNRQFIKLSDH